MLRLAVFLVLLGFAVKNDQPATLRFYFGYEWNSSLVVLLLFFLFAGTLIGILAMLGTVFRQRRELVALGRELQLKQQSDQPRVLPLSSDQSS
jgi:uncharacterized integral membrane protein